MLAAVSLAGCGRTGVGVAARVGDTRILTSSLEARVTRGYANKALQQQQSQAEYQRGWLNRLIAAELTKVAARRLGVGVTDAQVDARLDTFIRDAGSRELLEQQAAGQGIAKQDLRQAVYDLSLKDAVADKLVENVTVSEAQLRAEYQRQLVRLDVAHIAHILVKDEKTANDVVAQARAGGDFAALAKKYSQDEATKTNGGDLGNVGHGEGKFAKPFEDAVFSGRTGSIVGPIKAQAGFEIVKVIERRTTTFEQAQADLRRAIIGQQRDQRLGDYLTALAKELRVSVNPRFGRWDPANVGVTTTSDTLSFPVATQAP